MHNGLVEIERSLFWQLAIAKKRLLGRLEQELAPAGLNVPQFVVLRITGHDGVMSPGELAERLGLDRPAISRLLRALKEQGFIRSRRSKIDARHDELRLTAAGEEKLAEAERHYSQFDSHLSQLYSVAELDAILDLLNRFTEAER